MFIVFDCVCFAYTDSSLLNVIHRKTASLGELIQKLAPLGVDVPGGFGVGSTAYDAVLNRCSLRERLRELLVGIDGKGTHSNTHLV